MCHSTAVQWERVVAQDPVILLKAHAPGGRVPAYQASAFMAGDASGTSALQPCHQKKSLPILHQNL